MIESKVPPPAVAIVWATARNTVRRKSADRSGGKSPVRNFHSAAAVAGRRGTPGRTSANRQEAASSANAAIIDRIEPDVVSGGEPAGIPVSATAFVLAVVAIQLLS